MKATTTVLRWWVRITGPIMIVLGILFWTGNADALIPIHMLIGLTIVLALWTLATLGAFVRVRLGLVALAIGWGVLMPVLGITQVQLLPGPMHWLVQVAHLVVGLVALGLADTLARRILDRLPSNASTRRERAAEGAVR